MKTRGHSKREIGCCLGSNASTISREMKRNSFDQTDKYWAGRAHAPAIGRRHKSRSNSQYSQQEWAQVEDKLQQEWSPMHVVGTRYLELQPTLSHELIYRRIRLDRYKRGRLWSHMRQMSKAFRKKKGSPAMRGRLVGKKHISERPLVVELRQKVGHCEGDTAMGAYLRHCVLTLVERVTGFVQIKKLSARTAEHASAALAQCVIKMHGVIKSITLDNGTEFHGYEGVEKQSGIPFYFAKPYHSWERGTNENTNWLFRQDLPKGKCLKELTQAECDTTAAKLNSRPRERLGFRTSLQMPAALSGVPF